MKKKFTLALACVLAMTTMLNACGGSGQTPASDGSSSAITVKYSVTFSRYRHAGGWCQCVG